MSNYEQAMKHWKNHRKDRFYQQCGFCSTSDTVIDKEETVSALTRSELEKAKNISYPAYVHYGYMGAIELCDSKALGSVQVNSYEEILKYV